MAVPFPSVDGEFCAQQIAIAPDRTAYRVPSGFHERLQRTVAPDQDGYDPKVALAVAGGSVCRPAV